MDIKDNYPLKDWRSSELLVVACQHLVNHPEYVKMRPEAEVEMKRFCHALRRELMVAKAKNSHTQAVINHMHSEYLFDVSTNDHVRYKVNVHGYPFIIYCS